MNEPFQFSDVVGQYVRAAGYTSGQLARMTGIPKTTIVSWLEGWVKRPRQWRDIVKLAAILHLNAPQATMLLRSAGFPAVLELIESLDNPQDRGLFSPWIEAATQPSQMAPFQALPDLPYFVGREQEIEMLKDALLVGRRAAICFLQGMGGVGKTALAAHVTYQLRPYFPDGVLWARLDASETLSILSTFASAYGRNVSEYPDLDSRSRVVRELLANKRALVVLDNAQSSDEILPLLPPSGACAVIVTTRRHDLSVALGGHRFCIGPFSSERYEALALFSTILGKDRAIQDGAALSEIAELLGHLPLAVAIAASRLAYEPDWSAGDFLRRLHRERRRLDELCYENQNVRLSFNLSYKALSPSQQQFFAALGVFDQEDFSTEAIAYVTDRSLEHAQDILRKLYSLSLVQQGQPGRYRLHPLLRDFAKEKICSESVFERMVEYFVHFVDTHQADFDALDREHRNVLAALEGAFERGMHTALVEGVSAFYSFLATRCLCVAAETHLSRAQVSAQHLGDTRREILLLLKRGQNACCHADYAQAEARFSEVMAYPDLPADLRAMLDRQMSQLLWLQGKCEAAKSDLERALALARTVQLTLPDQAGESIRDVLCLLKKPASQETLASAGQLTLDCSSGRVIQSRFQDVSGGIVNI